MSPPQTLKAVRQDGVFEVQWPDGPLHRLPFHAVRCLCPCATCVNEFTGERVLQPNSVPQDVAPTAMAPVGNYAVKITWSDGHNTGLYTWEHFAGIAQGIGG